MSSRIRLMTPIGSSPSALGPAVRGSAMRLQPLRRAVAYHGALLLGARAVARRMLDVARPSRVLVQLEFHGIDQRLPTRLDHVAGEPDRAPAPPAVGRFNQHAHARRSAGAV